MNNFNFLLLASLLHLTYGGRWGSSSIPYVISDEFDWRQVKMIKSAFEMYRNHTCVDFIPRQGQRDYVHIRKSWGGCAADIGRQKGDAVVWLGTECIKRGPIMHELMHILGFRHEHNRPDRDNYVRIIFHNVQLFKRFNFDKNTVQEVRGTSTEPYDYASIMHYGVTSFTSNGGRTIVPLDSPDWVLGQMQQFSTTDIRRINNWMNCAKPTPKPKSLNNCKDENDGCAKLASIGFCKTHDHTRQNCRKSCKLCFRNFMLSSRWVFSR